MDRSSLKALGRAGLQRLAKAKGVRAVGPSSKIIDSLLECVKGKSTASDETPVPQEMAPDVFKDVKNSAVVKPDAAEGSSTPKSGRLATAVDKTETANKNERPQQPCTKGTRGSRENTALAPVTRPRSLSPDELTAIQAMLLFQDIPPRTADPRKPPATSNTKRKRDGADSVEQAPTKAPTSKQSQKRRKTERS